MIQIALEINIAQKEVEMNRSSLMTALTFDRSREAWSQSKGLVKEQVPRPVLTDQDRDMAIVQIKIAGFCGSDRGIWYRKAFGDMIDSSLDEEQSNKRIVGHEFLGQVIEVGGDVTRIRSGDMVAAESHIVCEQCLQCLNGSYVCARDKIIGISHDGCFAEYIKIPARCLWPTNTNKIVQRLLLCKSHLAMPFMRVKR